MEKTRICLLGSAFSIHTVRWANALVEKNLEVHLLTQHNEINKQLKSEVKVHKLPIKGFLGYYLNSFYTTNLIEKIKPNIVHAHYASGYGTLLRKTKITVPSLLSVWGSDVYDFPKQSNLKRKILIKNLNASDYIASTSRDMEKEIRKYNSNKKIFHTPFGVDIEMFDANKPLFENSLTIGTVKTMEDIYGIENLVRAFKLLINELPNEKLKLLLVGGGSQIEEYKKLSLDLSLNSYVDFTGQVDHRDVPKYLEKLHVYCAPSINESFGVAVLEASSCRRPVVVSDVGGLPEVVQDGKTGKIVKANDIVQLKDAIKYFVVNKNEILKYGEFGRMFVEETYEWDKTVENLINIYNSILKGDIG